MTSILLLAVLCLQLFCFQPVISQQLECSCNGREVECDDPCLRNGFAIAGGIFGGLFLIALITVLTVLLCCFIHYWRKRVRHSATNRESAVEMSKPPYPSDFPEEQQNEG
jgi:hypothetical protein